MIYCIHTSLVKTTPLLWLHNKPCLSQQKNCLRETVCHFIGVCIINITLHGRLEIQEEKFHISTRLCNNIRYF